MDPELLARFDAQDKKLDAIFVSVEKTRKYFLWTIIATVVTVALPLIALAFVMPWFLSTITAAYTIQ